MQESEQSLEQLVIEANPGAQVTYEIAKQLVQELPLSSSEQLRECLGERGLEIGRAVVSADQILFVLSEDAFPVRDAKELVTKVAAAIRTGVEIMMQTGQIPMDEEQTKLLMTLALEPRNRAEVATGYFGGPSLFGEKRVTTKEGD